MSTSYRILVKIGWAFVAIAVYFAGAAALLDSSGVWWMVVGLAVSGLSIAALLPEPVPDDYLDGHRTRVRATGL